MLSITLAQRVAPNSSSAGAQYGAKGESRSLQPPTLGQTFADRANVDLVLDRPRDPGEAGLVGEASTPRLDVLVRRKSPNSRMTASLPASAVSI